MPRKNNTEELPKARPKRPPKGKPKAAPEITPNPQPKQSPKTRAIRRPIVTSTITPSPAPENTVYLVYELPYFDQPGHPGYRKCHPKFYGQCLGEFFTDRDAKDSLKRHEQYGHFAVAERINGQIGLAWPIEIEEPEEIHSGDDLALLDPDEIDDSDLLDPRLVRRDIKIARLESRLEAQSNGHTRNGYDPLTKTVLEQVLPQIIKPPKSAVEEIREAKELMAELTPRREVNPAPAPPPVVDPKVEALKAIAGDPELREIAKDAALEIIGVKRKGDSDPWAEAFSKFIDHPQFPQIAQSAVTVVGNLVGNALSGFASLVAPKSAQAPAQQAAQSPQQPAPAVQPTQAPPQVAQAETPALPVNNQQTQAAQMDQGPMQMAPVDALVYSLIQLMEKQAPIADAQNVVNIAIVRNPELGDSVDEILNLTVDQVLALLTAYHPPVAQMPHAREWLTSLINALTAESGDEFEKELET